MVRDLSESWEYLHAISNVCRWFSRSFAQLVHYIIIIISILLLLSSLWLCGWVSAYVYYYWFLCYLKFFFLSSVKCFFSLAIRYFYYRTLFIDWSKYFLMPFWVESVLNVIVWFPFPFLFNAIILYHIILLSFFSKTRVRWHICDAKPRCSNLYMQIFPCE